MVSIAAVGMLCAAPVIHRQANLCAFATKYTDKKIMNVYLQRKVLKSKTRRPKFVKTQK